MTPIQYIGYAKTFGYDVVYTGLGMAYITLGDIMLTEVKDSPVIQKELALIGKAIMQDTLRAMPEGMFTDD